MLHYRIVRAIVSAYPLTMFWLYVGAFLLAFTLMFVFPPGTLLMLGLSLSSLVFVVAIYRVLAAVLRFLARMILARGSCPCCAGWQTGCEAGAWPRRCRDCDGLFAETGAEETEAQPVAA